LKLEKKNNELVEKKIKIDNTQKDIYRRIYAK
jgi:hypothetical protein